MRYFVEKGHDVHLLTVQPGPIPGVTVHDITSTHGPKPVRYLTSLWRVQGLLESLDPDVLHTHFLTGYGYWGDWSGFRPLLITLWGDDVYTTPFESKAKLWLARRALSHASWITGDSRDMLEVAIRRLSARRETTEFLQLGVDFRQFDPSLPTQARQELDTPPGAPVVLSTRSFSQPYYNIEVFVDALPEIRARHPDAVFWIAGYEGSDQAVRERAERLGVAESVRFLGRVPHEKLPSVLAAADVYITIPSVDATAVSLLEAMAMGKAIVASSLPAAMEWIREGETGLLVPPAERAPLVAQISRFLSDPSLRAAVGQRARAEVRARADYHRHMARCEAVYEAAAKARREGRPLVLPEAPVLP